MWRHVRFSGRQSELDAQIGAMVRHAEARGVPIPCYSVVYSALLPQELALGRRASKAAMAAPRLSALGLARACLATLSFLGVATVLVRARLRL